MVGLGDINQSIAPAYEHRFVKINNDINSLNENICSLKNETDNHSKRIDLADMQIHQAVSKHIEDMTRHHWRILDLENKTDEIESDIAEKYDELVSRTIWLILADIILTVVIIILLVLIISK